MILPDHLHLSFYYGPSSFVHDFIRRWTDSKVSHVEIVAPGETPGDGATCDSIAASISEGRRVVRRPVTFAAGEWVHVAVPWLDPATSGWDRAAAEEGRPYDMRGLVLSHMFNARRETPGEWFCSELAAHAVGLASPQDFSPGQLLLRIREMNELWRAARAGDGLADGPGVTPFDGGGEMPMSSAPMEEEMDGEEMEEAAPPPPPPAPQPKAAPRPETRSKRSAPPPEAAPTGGGDPFALPPGGPVALPEEATAPMPAPDDPAAAADAFRRLYRTPPGEGGAS